jgi:azurin
MYGDDLKGGLLYLDSHHVSAVQRAATSSRHLAADHDGVIPQTGFRYDVWWRGASGRSLCAGPIRGTSPVSSKGLFTMTRHSLCAALCTVAMTLSPALALAQATKAAPKAAAPKAAAGAVKTFTVTGTDNMKFAPAILRVKAGDKVKVSLKVVSAMPKMVMAHNFVLLKAGADAAAVATAGAAARDTAHISPKSKPQILAASALAGAGETVDVEFTAPAAGKYQFICTFPGHFQAGMVGQLIVE